MRRSTPKRDLLRQQGALNPRAAAVTDELFQQSEFFDPADSVQVKYEMLRQVQVEGQPVSEAARAFGFSRPSFYQVQAAFDESGLPGLLPQKRGPKAGHKLTAEVMDFVRRQREEEPFRSWEELGRLIQQRFQITIHPRSIARQWAHQKKTPIGVGDRRDEHGADLTAAYEHLRGQVLGAIANCPRGPGLAVFLQSGMKAWIEVYSRWKEQAPTDRCRAAPQKHSDSQRQNEIVVLLTRLLLERR